MRWRPYVTMMLPVAVAAVVAGLAGYMIGHHKKSPFVVGPGIVYAGQDEGTAYIGTDEPLNRQPRGFAYLFPPTVSWIDASGTIHQAGQRPNCVPIYHAVHVAEMEAVKFPISGGYMGTVLWVRC